jgi:hypothetical protein
MAFVRSTAMHTCPGGCRGRVSNRLYACRDDWARLPQEFKDMVRRTAGREIPFRERVNALQAAAGWYRDNRLPEGGAS